MITRLQVQRHLRAQSGIEAIEDDYKDLIDAAQKIYKNEGGLKAFYAGLGQDLAKGVADSFLFFLAYSLLRKSRQRSQGATKLPVLEELGIGMAAGAFAKLFTTPVQNVVTRKQTAAMLAKEPGSSVNPDLSTKDIALQIREQKGIQGFWSGYSATLLLTLNPGLTFLLHELLLRVYLRTTRKTTTGPKATFAIAAFSKAIASSITYPLSVAKSRAQVSSKKPVERHVGGDVSKGDSLGDVENKVEAKVERNTVIGEVLKIAREEGIAGLYAGLAGEVLKGYFQHGLTMVMKDRIFTVVVQLYYLALKALRKYPSPEELAAIAKERAERAAEEAKQQGERILERGTAIIKDATSAVTDPSSRPSVPAGDVYGKGPGKS